jgi:hypothetical protein
MRNAQVTVAERDFPMALEMSLALEDHKVCRVLAVSKVAIFVLESRPQAWQGTNKAGRDLPVYKHATTSVESALNESIAFWEMFEQVFVLYIVHLHGHVCEAIKQALLHWKLQYGKYMCDSSFSKRFFPTESE